MLKFSAVCHIVERRTFMFPKILFDHSTVPIGHEVWGWNEQEDGCQKYNPPAEVFWKNRSAASTAVQWPFPACGAFKSRRVGSDLN